MEWTDFIKYLATGYLLYYGILVVLDLLRTQRGAVAMGEEDILEFSEETETTIIEDREEAESGNLPSLDSDERGEMRSKEAYNTENIPLYGENVNISTGGIHRMGDLFRLAQDETIEFKKKLVY